MPLKMGANETWRAIEAAKDALSAGAKNATEAEHSAASVARSDHGQR